MYETIKEILNKEIPKKTVKWFKEQNAVEVKAASYIIDTGDAYSDFYLKTTPLEKIKAEHEKWHS